MPDLRRLLGRAIGPDEADATSTAVSSPAGANPATSSQEILATIARVTGDMIFLLDKDGQLRWRSGASTSEIEGEDHSEPPTDNIENAAGSGQAAWPEIVEALDQLGVDVTKGQLPEQGQLIRLGEGLHVATGGDLASEGRIISLRDVSATERLTRARHDMVANISHDLRTPLTSLGLLTDSLDSPLADDTRWRQTVTERIRSQLGSIEDLADGMVALNRIESGRTLLRLEALSVTELTDRAVRNLRPQLDGRNIRVSQHIPQDLLVLADRPNIHRVLTNLLENAIFASPESGEIQFGACRIDGDEPWVEIEIADRGPGIPPAEIDRIFERFFRADRARTQGGSGLGLAIARHIVEGHGGRIRAENRASGGARLSFTLPLSP